MGIQFDYDVAAWADATVSNLSTLVKTVGEDALSRVKELTPVKTGNLRAHWTVTIGGAEKDTVSNAIIGGVGSWAGGAIGAALGAAGGPVGIVAGAVVGGEIGDEALRRAAAVVSGSQHEITITNPVEYAARIEYGFQGKDALGREYHQEGRHMMQQTINEMPQIIARAAERLKK